MVLILSRHHETIEAFDALASERPIFVKRSELDYYAVRNSRLTEIGISMEAVT